MDGDVREFINRCDICTMQKGRWPSTIELQPMPIEAPWRRVYMDVCELSPSTRGNRCYIVLMDHFTKWLEVHAVPHATSEEVADFFLHDCICRPGCPIVLHVDQGTHFRGALIPLLGAFGVYMERSRREHLEGSGLVERYIRTLKANPYRLESVETRKWDE